MALIAVESLWHVYPEPGAGSAGEPALRGVDLTVEAGEALALLGESGAGKTTLAKHLNGLLRPSRGRVLVGGLDTARTPVSRLASIVGYVFQNPLHQLFAESVEAEVALGPRAQGWPAAAAAARVAELLDTFGLARYRLRHPLTLSEGERRRVALAATLAARPRALVLDEPTVGQDHGEKLRLGRLIRELTDGGVTVVAITHDVEFAAEHCRRCVVMAGGRVVADGPSRRVLAEAETLAAAGLEPPQVVQLGQALAPLGFAAGALTVGEARREVARLLEET